MADMLVRLVAVVSDVCALQNFTLPHVPFADRVISNHPRILPGMLDIGSLCHTPGAPNKCGEQVYMACV